MSHETLAIIWFVLIAVLWCGYFVLEGFDFGVGILLPFLGKNEAERRTIVSTLGPVWDGNEVWLLTAGGAMFAAFSLWYATLFSGFYLALLLILVALIIRGVAFEFRSKRGTATSPKWRRNWDIAIFIGSFLPAFLSRIHGFSVAQAGYLTAIVYLVGGVSGGMLAGHWGDRIVHRRTDGRLLSASLLSAVGAPFGIGSLASAARLKHCRRASVSVSSPEGSPGRSLPSTSYAASVLKPSAEKGRPPTGVAP